MQFSYLLLVVSLICLIDAHSDQLITDLIKDNFGIEQQSVDELNAINKLLTINKNIFEFFGKQSRQNWSRSDVSYLQTRRYKFVVSTVRRILDAVGFKNLYLNVRDGVSTAVTCLTCHSLATIIFNDIISRDNIAMALHEVCIALHLSTAKVCVGLIDQMRDHVDYIRKNSRLTPLEVCGILMGNQCFIGRSDSIFWKLKMPNKTGNAVMAEPNPEDYSIRILQLTDIHLDLDYQFGADIRCNEPLCCRDSHSAGNESAGKWGSYPCDIPLQTVDSVMNEISDDKKRIDMWYWTGDIVAHDIWQYSRSSNLRYSQLVIDLFRQYSNDKPIVPVIGNHETVPVNCAGYYTLTIKPTLRVIVLNTNYCARLNIWTYYSPVDPANQLSWLIEQLLSAEQSGVKVHIVGHVPVDNRECTQAYVHNYLSIVERFSDTIVAQFFGHTHSDEFRVLYSNENSSKPIGFELLSPSLTTFENFNPAYRIITVNSKGIIQEIDTYFMNLTNANHISKSSPRSPLWHFEYSMKSEYQLTDIDGQQLDRLLDRLMTNDDDLYKFYAFYYRHSDQLRNECSEQCRQRFVSDIRIGNPFDKNPKSIMRRG